MLRLEAAYSDVDQRLHFVAVKNQQNKQASQELQNAINKAFEAGKQKKEPAVAFRSASTTALKILTGARQLKTVA